MHKYNGGGVSLAYVMDMPWSKQTLAASALPVLGHVNLWHTKGWASPKKNHVHLQFDKQSVVSSVVLVTKNLNC